MKRYQKIKQCFFVFALLGMSLFFMATNAQAETGTGTVKGNNVNVRSDAGTTAGRLISLSSGDVLVVSGTKKDSAGNVWYAVTFTKNGKEYKGYIISSYVNYKPAETSPSSDSSASDAGGTQTTTAPLSKWKGTVTATNVNVRKKAVSGNVVGVVTKDASVTVRKSATGSDGKVWYYISFKLNGSTQKGWIRSDFIKKAESQPASGTTASADASTAQNGTTEIDVSKIVEGEQNDNKSNSSQQADSGKADEAQQTASVRKGVLTGDYVRVRKKAVSGAVICQLNKGQQLTVKSEKKASDGYIWYKVTFTYGGKNKSGYIRSDFVSVTEETGADDSNEQDDSKIDVSQDTGFESYMTQQGFPESYKNALRSLHKTHPDWEFRAVQTGLVWDDVVTEESRVGANLVSKNAIVSWKSTEKTAYNFKTNQWYTFDGGAWVAASKEIISYYLDPRNFLTETAIFQFESLEYEEYQNRQGVRRLLSGSFMSGKYTEPDGKQRGYAATFVNVGKKVGVSPYHLAARCYQEQGKGTSGSVSGKVEGYENIFNYYNIGAYASGGNSPVVQGLKYASMQSSGSTNYGRPWNTRYKALLGGAQYVAMKYVKVGQNTLYFQKFNVVNKKNGLYRHQYMTNIQAAESEAVKMSKAYSQEDTRLVFYIPVYQNMPEAACAKPVSNTNPNNYLATLEIEGQQLTPIFNPETESYDLAVPKKIKKVNISATAVAQTTKVEGTGQVKLERGENTIKITCTAENGAVRIYTLHIVRG